MKRKSPKLLRRIRYLTLGILLSGVLNVTLLGFVFYLFVHHDEVPANDWHYSEIAQETTGEAPLSVAAVLPSYEVLTFEELVLKLGSRRPLEDGYRDQDLALATLVAIHDFDLTRALGRPPIEKRIVRFSGQTAGHLPAIALFPGLSKDQFKKIQTFAREEEWPLTSHGLFRRLKKAEGKPSETLIATFVLTPEFHSVEQLIIRSGAPYEQEEIVELLTTGNWKTVSDFDQSFRETHNLSPEKRRAFLIAYVEQGSVIGAHLLVRSDRLYIAAALDDNQLVAVISKLDHASAEIRSLLIDILVSPRATVVWIAAAERLYTFAGESMPQPYNHIATLTRFVPEETLRSRVELGRPTKKAPLTLHQVEDGDSLWKIAHHYGTTVAKLRNINKLDTDLIRRGQTLSIPSSEDR